MFTLSEETKKNIEKDIGLTTDSISKMDFESIDTQIEKKIKKKLTFKPINDSRLIGRGSVYLFLRRLLRTFVADKKISQI